MSTRSFRRKPEPSRCLLAILVLGLLVLVPSPRAWADEAQHLFVKEKTIDSRLYRFEKVLQSDSETSYILDEEGRDVELPSTGERSTLRISEDLLMEVSRLQEGTKIAVYLVLRNQTFDLPDNEPGETGHALLAEDTPTEVSIDGHVVDTVSYKEQWLQRHDESLPFPPPEDCNQHPMVPSSEVIAVSLSKQEIMAVLDDPTSDVMGIERQMPIENDMVSAVLESGVDPWAFFPGKSQGEGTKVYMQERDGCIEESLHYINTYRDVRGSTSSLSFAEHAIKTTGVLHAVAPKAEIHCAGGGFSLPSPAPFIYVPGIGFCPNPDPAESYDAVSVSLSQAFFGSYLARDKEWDNFIYRYDVPIFQSAGNDGSEVWGYVSSPGTAFNAITVGNYDHKSGPPTISSKSGWINGETGINKPEIVAPGTNLDIVGIDPPMFYGRSGTSYSTPHAAGFYLDFIGDEPWFSGSAALAKAFMVSRATINVAGGSDKVGNGGIHYRSGGGNIYWWDEPNSAWSSMTNNGSYLDLPVAVNWERQRARVAIAWLTRGDYTFSHQDDPHSIGIDFDMRVIDGHGNYVCGSASWDNTYESCSWTLPPTPTTYIVRINRYANRDTGSRIKLAAISQSFNDQ